VRAASAVAWRDGACCGGLARPPRIADPAALALCNLNCDYCYLPNRD
jgi:sulfatase maturation enzyme AslB (radical SAM superfamily)